jgi:hypothetical protein
MGWATAPVCGSGVDPARTASVSKLKFGGGGAKDGGGGGQSRLGAILGVDIDEASWG